MAAELLGELPFVIFFSLIYALPAYFMAALDLDPVKVRMPTVVKARFRTRKAGKRPRPVRSSCPRLQPQLERVPSPPPPLICAR